MITLRVARWFRRLFAAPQNRKSIDRCSDRFTGVQLSKNRIQLMLVLLAVSLVSRREFFIRQRSSAQYDTVDSHALIEIGIVGLALLLVLIIPRVREAASMLRNCSIGLLAVYCSFGIATSLFSRNLKYSAFFAGEYLSQVLLLFAIFVLCASKVDVVKVFVRTSIVVTLLAVGFKIYYFGFSGTLYDYKSNGGGACGAMLFVYCFVYFMGETYPRELKKTLIAGMVVGVAALALTTSAASIISTAFGVAISSLLAGRGKGPLLALVTLMVVGGLARPDTAIGILFPGKSTRQIESMHGRTQLWESSVGLVSENPWFGYGYAMAAKIGHLGGTNLHNSLMSVIVGNGLIGLSIFAFAVFACYRESQYLWMRKIPGAMPACVALATGLVNANTISFYGEDWRGASYLFVSLWSIVSISYLMARRSDAVQR